jgi:hypothetical protein
MKDLEKTADDIIAMNEPFIITDEWLMKNRTKKEGGTISNTKYWVFNGRLKVNGKEE